MLCETHLILSKKVNNLVNYVAEVIEFSGVAIPSNITVTMDNNEVSFNTYNINDSNYVRLRDFAYALNGTENQIEIAWNAQAESIEVITGSRP